MTKDEKKKKHERELNVARVKRYLEKHPMRYFNARIDADTYDIIDKRLAKDGITKKEFILRSFKLYLENGGFKK